METKKYQASIILDAVEEYQKYRSDKTRAFNSEYYTKLSDLVWGLMNDRDSLKIKNEALEKANEQLLFQLEQRQLQERWEEEQESEAFEQHAMEESYKEDLIKAITKKLNKADTLTLDKIYNFLYKIK